MSITCFFSLCNKQAYMRRQAERRGPGAGQRPGATTTPGGVGFHHPSQTGQVGLAQPTNLASAVP
jgi:hypothetical protein